MKGKWVMLWDVRWTNSVEDIGGKEFNSFDAVKKAAREKIREIDVSDVVASIRSGINKDYRNAIGNFFERYFADPNFPRSEEDIPSTDIGDYPMPEPEMPEEEEETDDFDDIEYNEPEEDTELSIWISTDRISTQDENALPRIVTNLIFPEETKGKYYEEPIMDTDDFIEFLDKGKGTTFIFDDDAPKYIFQFDPPKGGTLPLHGKARVNSACIKFCKIFQPELLDVVSVLKNSSRPMSRQDVANITMADTRTLSHQVAALTDLGVIRDVGGGSYELVDAVGGAFHIAPTKKPGTSVYPILILDVLERSAMPMNMQDIADAVRQKYGIAIKRQTVSSHLAHLRELGYQIQKDANGYTIQVQN